MIPCSQLDPMLLFTGWLALTTSFGSEALMRALTVSILAAFVVCGTIKADTITLGGTIQNDGAFVGDARILLAQPEMGMLLNTIVFTPSARDQCGYGFPVEKCIYWSFNASASEEQPPLGFYFDYFARVSFDSTTGFDSPDYHPSYTGPAAAGVYDLHINAQQLVMNIDSQLTVLLTLSFPYGTVRLLDSSGSVQFSPTPEPGTIALTLAGLLGGCWFFAIQSPLRVPKGPGRQSR